MWLLYLSIFSEICVNKKFLAFTEAIATEEELKSAKVPLRDRDYCAHKLLTYYACRKDNFPWVVKCAHEKHDYLNCQHEE